MAQSLHWCRAMCVAATTLLSAGCSSDGSGGDGGVSESADGAPAQPNEHLGRLNQATDTDDLRAELCGDTEAPAGLRWGDRVVVKSVDMPEELQNDAINAAVTEIDEGSVEKDVAAFIKNEFDKKHGPNWQCVVGRNFASLVTPETRRFIYFYVGQIAVLLFQTG